VNVGNEFLKPEKALSVETGIKGELKVVYYEAFVFNRWGKEMIDWVMHSGDDKWRSENLTQVQLSGFGIILYVPFFSLSASQPPSQEEAVKVSYHYISGEKAQKDFISNYVFDYLRHQIVLSANRYMTPRLGLGLSVSWQDREGEYMLYQDGEFVGMKQFEPFWIMDAGMFFDSGRLQWFAEVSNILHTTVVNHANVPQPGRWFRAGVRGRFHLQRR
jgi:vitamin B12 transporter